MLMPTEPTSPTQNTATRAAEIAADEAFARGDTSDFGSWDACPFFERAFWGIFTSKGLLQKTVRPLEKPDR